MADHTDETPIVKSKNAARQGVTGHNVRLVLFLGLSGAIIALVVVWLSVTGAMH